MRNLLFCLTLLGSICAQAQTHVDWSRNYGGSNKEQANRILVSNHGGYVLVGYSSSMDGDVPGNNGQKDLLVVKIDSSGGKEWSRNFGGSSEDSGYGLQNTPDGGYLITARSYSANGDVTNNHGFADFWLLKLSAAGNLEWEKSYGGSEEEIPYDMIATADGDYLMVGTAASDDGDLSGNLGIFDLWIVKVDAAGNIVWQKNYGGSDSDSGLSCKQTADGGYIVGGGTYSTDGGVSTKGLEDCWILKLDALGAVEWQKTYGGSADEYINAIQQTADGGYVVTATTYSSDGDVGIGYGERDIWVFKTDSNGNMQWGHTFGGIGFDVGNSIVEDENGDFLALGVTQTDFAGNIIPADYWLLKLNPSGALIWEQRLGGPGADTPSDIIRTPDNGLILAGQSREIGKDVVGNYGQGDFWALKLSKVPGLIRGHAYLDNNGDCIENGSDTIIRKMLVYAENLNTFETNYTYTDPLGQYQLDADTVAHKVGYVRPSPYFLPSLCSPVPRLVTLSENNQVDSADFYLSPNVICPYLTVDIATIALHRCQKARYYVNYCNDGTAVAENASVAIAFSPLLTVLGSSIPWTTIDGNTYTFPIGNVAMFECGAFWVTVAVDCDSTYIGQTICTEAHIYPDSFCMPLGAWSGAELKASATCIGHDSVELKLQNIGSEDMPAAVPFLVIEDVIMRTTGQVQLHSMESTSWILPVDGFAERIIAQQPDNHPFKTFTTAAVNLCKTENLPPVPGPIEDFMTVYENDEEAPFVAVDCQAIIAAFDPNDKTVQPTGRGEYGFIEATTALTYKIRFQNTGNDTAFTVTLLDTLAPQLNVATLKTGASSHAYRTELSGHGVLKFIFDNILLPDSTTNFNASQGFVQFSIQQNAGNMNGDVITNSANIYFDYNPPVQTNTVKNTLGEIFVIEMVPSHEANAMDAVVRVFPNPAKDRVTVTLPKELNGFDFLLYDVHGKMVQQISATGSVVQLYRKGLAEGLYMFQVVRNGVPLAQGKLIFQ